MRKEREKKYPAEQSCTPAKEHSTYHGVCIGTTVLVQSEHKRLCGMHSLHKSNRPVYLHGKKLINLNASSETLQKSAFAQLDGGAVIFQRDGAPPHLGNIV